MACISNVRQVISVCQNLPRVFSWAEERGVLQWMQCRQGSVSMWTLTNLSYYSTLPRNKQRHCSVPFLDVQLLCLVLYTTYWLNVLCFDFLHWFSAFCVAVFPQGVHCCHWKRLLHFAWVVDDAKCIVVTRVCVSFRGRTPTLLHGPGCNLGTW